MPSWANATPTGPTSPTTSDTAVPHQSMSLHVPVTADLPADTLILNGPDSVHGLGGVPGLVRALSHVLEREGPAVVVATSGSTGRPKKTVLSTHAVRNSAEATAEHLGGHGQWLLCLPAHYVAGVQVLVRSVLARTTPVLMQEGSFTAQNFAQAAAQMDHPVRYVSLVPTQLQRLIDAADSPEVLAALRSFTAILLGGSAAPPTLLSQARDMGANVLTTYGMSETAGGCVYDGLPLPGVQIHVEAAPDPGRVWLGGPVVADGYLDDPQQTRRHIFTALPHRTSAPHQSPTTATGTVHASPANIRWYRTDDLGALESSPGEPTPRLRVIGRADDVIVTGAVKVSASVVRSHLLEHPGVRDAVVVPVADEQWGQRIVAAVVAAGEPSTLQEELHRLIKDRLGPAAAPKQVLLVSEIPLLPSGKPDRSAVAELFVKQ